MIWSTKCSPTKTDQNQSSESGSNRNLLKSPKTPVKGRKTEKRPTTSCYSEKHVRKPINAIKRIFSSHTVVRNIPETKHHVSENKPNRRERERKTSDSTPQTTFAKDRCGPRPVWSNTTAATPIRLAPYWSDNITSRPRSTQNFNPDRRHLRRGV